MFLRVVTPLLFACLVSPSLAQGDKAAAKIDFEKQVWPILEKNCLECHTTKAGADGKPKKPKGGVNFESKDKITSSKKGKLVIAKKPDDSLIVQSISLPADDEDRMPPAKKGGPLPEEQQKLIREWIAQGADFGKWTGKANDAEADKGKGDKPADKPKENPGEKPGEKPAGKPKEGANDPLPKLQAGLAPLAPAVLQSFAQGPFTVTSIGDDSPLLRVSCAGHTDEVDDKAIAALAPLANHVTELDLGRSRVGDEGCAALAKMKNLTVLDLRQTQVGNHGVAALAACKELRSLNLFGTKVGDYGATALASCKNLQDLYVWQTEVSANAVVRLRESVPGARIVVAADLPEPMADTGAARRRAR